MGLAAGQARLLTITGRKSDCEFESMRLSHQKIALARELAYISNEYQNSLEQTKLVYDYYGTGDTSTPLSYGLLMTPSALNDYMPTLLTDSAGRIMLNGKLALAAKAAGIPQEGLGTLPSETMRNNFIAGLIDNGVLNTYTGEKIMSLPYNQAAGMGGGATVAITTKDVNIDELLDDYLCTYQVNLDDITGDHDAFGLEAYVRQGMSGDIKKLADDSVAVGEHNISSDALSLSDFLRSDYNIALVGTNADNDELRGNNGNWDYTWRNYVQNMELWDVLNEAASDLFDLGDAFTQKAIEYAQSSLNVFLDVDISDLKKNLGYYSDNRKRSQGKVEGWAQENAWQYIGLTQEFNSGDAYNDGISVNLSYLAKAYLTYIADFINGVAKTDAYGRDIYYVETPGPSSVSSCKFVTDDDNYLFKIKTGTDISSDDLGQATFYDAMFNQICLHGWAENEHVTDNDYLKDMLQNGMMFISKVKNDGFYYQGNYATDNYIKEVADETLIAQAEAKYNTEKAKLNAKEETLDLKMKNLDTEISSLTTEYDTVKNTISKNIEKSFKRYNA